MQPSPTPATTIILRNRWCCASLPGARSSQQGKRQRSSRCDYSSTPSSSNSAGSSSGGATTALVIGSSGALGSAVSRHLSSLGTFVLGADVVELPPDLTLDGFELDGFVPLPRNAGLTELTTVLAEGVHRYLDVPSPSSTSSPSFSRQRLDAIVCASGGWQMDPTASSTDFNDWTEVEASVREYTESLQRMIHMNLDPVVAASFLAQHYMNANGLLVVMGASAALQPTPGMLAYGIAKSASHHVVRTLGASTGKSLESKAVRQAGARARQALPLMDNLTCVGILPTVIDTPANRKANPLADKSQWTTPREIAKEIGSWIANPDLRPHSGSLLKVHPAPDGEALFELVR
jgi:dihydropteridine reductase